MKYSVFHQPEWLREIISIMHTHTCYLLRSRLYFVQRRFASSFPFEVVLGAGGRALVVAPLP